MKRLWLLLLLLASLAACGPTVYMIRHGEKPDGADEIGLSPAGEKRARCLRDVFGKHSEYSIGHIMAQSYKKSGKRKRPYDTVAPLGKDLGLKIDTSCDRDDMDCVVHAINHYRGKGNILICWQHGQMNNIIKQLGANGVSSFPVDRYDLIWTVPPPYDKLVDETSENCPRLDYMSTESVESHDYLQKILDGNHNII